VSFFFSKSRQWIAFNRTTTIKKISLGITVLYHTKPQTLPPALTYLQNFIYRYNKFRVLVFIEELLQ
jgi:hypothetical protein